MLMVSLPISGEILYNQLMGYRLAIFNIFIPNRGLLYLW